MLSGNLSIGELLQLRETVGKFYLARFILYFLLDCPP